MAAPWRVRGYDVERLLGTGGSGEVWRATVISSGDAVALKRLVLRDPEQAQRALAEAAKLRVLDHPHLVRLHDTVLDGDAAVLVLDLADGGTLADLLRVRGRLTPGEVITAIAPVAAALAHVHAAGVVHGDVSATNILFTPSGLPLLADLGVARLTGDDADAESTPAYVDPVVARGGIPTSHSDVFMLAAVALHALTGAPLWTANTAEVALEAAREGLLGHVEARLAAAELPPAMVAVLRRALQAEPFRRGTAADLALDLRHSGRPVAVELGAGRPRGAVDEARHAAVTPEPAGPPRFPSSRAAVPPLSHRPVPVPATQTRPRSTSRSGGRHAAVPVPPRSGRGREPRAQPVEPPTGGASEPTWDGASEPTWGGASEPTWDGASEPTWRPPPTNAIARRRPTLPEPRRAPPPRVLAAAGGVLLVLAAIAVVAALWHGGGPDRAAADPRPTATTSASGRRPPATSAPPTTTRAASTHAPSTQAPSTHAPSTHAPSTQAGSDTTTPASVPSTAASHPAGRPRPTGQRRWTRALRSLDATRTRAFATGDAGLLSHVYLPGPLRTADVASLHRLVPAGCGLQGVRTRFSDITARAGPASATISARVTLPVSRLVCHGVVTGRAAGAGPTRMRVTLVQLDDGRVRIADERTLATGPR